MGDSTLNKQTAKQKILSDWRILFSVSFAVVLILELFLCKMYMGDDNTFSGVLDDQSLMTFLKGRYMWWSSRVIIESVMIPVQVYIPYAWYVLNALVSAFVITYSPKFIAKEYSAWPGVLITCLALTVIPLNAYGGCGWITCTINYLWVWACGLVGLYPLVCILRDEKVSKWVYVLSLLCCFFAMNNEQFSALSLGVLVFFILSVGIFRKRFAYLLLPHLAINIWSLLFVLRSNGNAARLAYETVKYMPEFEHFTTIEKALNGFCSTMYVIQAGLKSNTL